MPPKGSNTVRLLAPTRRTNRGAWYAANKDRINKRRRARNAQRREHFQAYARTHYNANKSTYYQNTTAGKIMNKLVRNGFKNKSARIIADAIAPEVKSVYDVAIYIL